MKEKHKGNMTYPFGPWKPMTLSVLILQMDMQWNKNNANGEKVSINFLFVLKL